MPLPDVKFGPPDEAPLDWRKRKIAPDMDKDDDEELVKTPADVVEMLGFDPLGD